VDHKVIRVSAPVRLDFAGGWTDVPPFAAREGGAVVNAAIDLRVEAEFESGGDGILLRAEDLDLAVRIASAADLTRGGRLELHKAAVRMFPPGPGVLRTRSQVPPGSGLGSSGALDVALVAALTAVRGEHLSVDEIAVEACRLEIDEAELAGGRQDQYAAALGSCHYLTFHDERVTARRLQLGVEFASELARRTVVCYTGRSRVSGATITRVMQAYERGDAEVSGALRELTTIAGRMAEALEAGDLAGVGSLLSENWRRQQQLDAGMQTTEMAALEAAMREAGALGGKAAGAGAGGSMFFVMGGEVRRGVEAAERVGARVLRCGWSSTGVERC
jgi:D-glycero-alpha-D-manno-heptose-7-phosphate kinase